MTVTLDYGVLGQLAGVFIWLLIFIVTYGLFSMIDPFKLKGGKGLYGLLAAVIAFMLVISNAFVAFFSFTLPWFAILIFVIFFLIFFGKVADPDGDLPDGGPGPYIFIGLVVIIILFGLGNVFGDTVREAQQPSSSQADMSASPTDTFIPADQVPTQEAQSQPSTVASTLFHPNVLGMLFILLVATAAVFTITRP